MTEPSARIVADSVSQDGSRLTTIEVVMHRFVLAEFNTHRVFSRNSASSRAIPLRKQLERVERGAAEPVVWATEQKGMQGGEPLTEDAMWEASEAWHTAAAYAREYAAKLGELGVHKSICNRLLEPFMWHTVIVSSTEWDNFWTQRCSPLAQPEIHAAADAMRAAYESSVPVSVEQGGWHLPYVQDEERSLSDETLCRLSAARCARVSYLTHDGKRDVDADLTLYERLVSASPPHASPLEHVATPAGEFEAAPVLGNFYGWRQLRHQVLSVHV